MVNFKISETSFVNLIKILAFSRCPSLQYMDDVDPSGVADMAGVNKGDFLLAINGEDVTQASHERVVTLIRQSGDLVALTVVTVTPEILGSTSTLPNPQRQFSTLPRKPPGVSGIRSPLQHPPPPPKRDPTTTLSVGRARAKSMVANMAAIDALDAAIKAELQRRFFAFLGHNRFLSSNARFIALPLYNRFFNYPFPSIIDSLTIPPPL